MSWRDRAACRGMTHLFFPPEGRGGSDYRRAKAICEGCPVQAECAAEGQGERYGLWGGLAPMERQRERRGWAPAVRFAAERMLRDGRTDNAVHRATGVPQPTVRMWRRQLGIRRKAGGEAA